MSIITLSICNVNAILCSYFCISSFIGYASFCETVLTVLAPHILKATILEVLTLIFQHSIYISNIQKQVPLCPKFESQNPRISYHLGEHHYQILNLVDSKIRSIHEGRLLGSRLVGSLTN